MGASLDMSALKRNVEALLFVAGEPLTVPVIRQALKLDETEHEGIVEEILAAVADEFRAGGARGFELVRLAGGWAFRTSPLAQAAVAGLYELPAEAGRLSAAAMECLGIVAYLQPVTRSQISEVRGVNSDSPVRTLLDRELITDVGRARGGGGAILYATTLRFEAMFGLGDLTELPALEGFSLGEEEKEDLRRRLGLASVAE